MYNMKQENEIMADRILLGGNGGGNGTLVGGGGHTSLESLIWYLPF
jgi:hypothetical protein